jgi:hypothetical protein
MHLASSFKDTAAAHLDIARKAAARGDYQLAVTEYQLSLERDRTLDEARTGLLNAQKHIGQSAAMPGAR